MDFQHFLQHFERFSFHNFHSNRENNPKAKPLESLSKWILLELWLQVLITYLTLIPSSSNWGETPSPARNQECCSRFETFYLAKHTGAAACVFWSQGFDRRETMWFWPVSRSGDLIFYSKHMINMTLVPLCGSIFFVLFSTNRSDANCQ